MIIKITNEHIVKYANQLGTIVSSYNDNTYIVELIDNSKIKLSSIELNPVPISYEILEFIGLLAEENHESHRNDSKIPRFKKVNNEWFIENQAINYIHELQDVLQKKGIKLNNKNLIKLLAKNRMLTYKSLKGALTISTNNLCKDKMLTYSSLKGALTITPNT